MQVVTLGTDGECLPSDWYLRLAGAAGEMLRGERRLTDEIPIRVPKPPAGRRCPPPAPVQLKISTTSDWTKVTVGGAPLTTAVITAASEDSTVTTDLNNRFVLLGQPLPRAQSGDRASATAELFLARTGARRLTIAIGRGSIGATTVEVLRADRRSTTTVATFTWSGVTGTDANEQRYSVTLPRG
ncbi:MAG: hypothetical protein R2731_18680 [Nocardioides sp.]